MSFITETAEQMDVIYVNGRGCFLIWNPELG